MPAETAAAEAPAKSVTEQLDAIFAPWNRTDEPGLVVGVVKDGALVYRRGFGMASLETGAANTPKTRMRIGSTSKHFTCLLALLLAEEGKLDLDAPIRTYLPELAGPGGEPTLRQLVQHRGGSRCYLDLGFIGHGMGVPPQGAALEAQARQSGRNFAPGTAMIYNNGGYHLVSIAIERIGGAPFEEQLKTRLFDVVGMPDTASIPSDHDITPGIATMHVPGRNGWRRGLFPSDEVRGEGAIVSTVDDMLRWMAHLRARDRFGSPETWAALTELPRYADGSLGVYALGLMVDRYRGLRIIHHAGGVMGGSSQMLTLPDDGVDVIVIANGGRDANPVRLAEQVVDIVLADRVGPETPTIPAEEFKPMLGDWWSPQTGMIYSLLDEAGVLKLGIAKSAMGSPLVRADDGRLVSPAGGMGEIALEPAGDRLKIRFGGETADYRRLVEDPADAAAFAAAAAGRYESADAGATATIEPQDDRLALHIADGHGAARASLVVLAPTLAHAKPRSPTGFHSTVSLLVEDGAPVGFRLDSPRTRNLEFRRV
ncbi:MAG TPA: serine hydrolase domain-containing protein [Caulobacteraceae bacterium]|jgi:CubicO group peptidase (beta-lactamase class C family)|nr:serine hydrolase domain-containing protein [Caulobacteraceae bacterium]